MVTQDGELRSDIGGIVQVLTPSSENSDHRPQFGGPKFEFRVYLDSKLNFRNILYHQVLS